MAKNNAWFVKKTQYLLLTTFKVLQWQQVTFAPWILLVEWLEPLGINLYLYTSFFSLGLFPVSQEKKKVWWDQF